MIQASQYNRRQRIWLVKLILWLLIAAIALVVMATVRVALATAAHTEVRVGVLHAEALPAPDSADLELRALGQRIFQGRTTGALCATCHGPEAKGVAGIRPDLTDAAWIHGDGGMEFLREIIRTGVTKPKKTGLVMPPYGGTTLKPAQLEAVAAYIYSLNASPR